MFDRASTESDQDYVPGEEESDDGVMSCDSDVSYDSDNEIPDEVEPVVDEGWQYLADKFKDNLPEMPP